MQTNHSRLFKFVFKVLLTLKASSWTLERIFNKATKLRSGTPSQCYSNIESEQATGVLKMLLFLALKAHQRYNRPILCRPFYYSD